MNWKNWQKNNVSRFKKTILNVVLMAVISLTAIPSSANAIFCSDLFEKSILQDSKVFSQEKLQHLSGNDPAAEFLIGQYLDFQNEYYVKKLPRYSNLTPQDRVKIDFQDIEVRNRSDFLVIIKGDLNTKNKIEFLGGIRAVFSKNQTERLPLEFEHNVRRLPVANGKISVEIGRLTSVNESSQLIFSMLKKVIENKDVEWVYVHTSKAHVRLYRKMGITTDRFIDIDKVSQLLAFSREDVERTIKQLAKNSK